MTLWDAPEQLSCIWSTLDWLILQMSKLKGWTFQSSLFMLWMDENSSRQSNKIADDEKITITLLFSNQTGPDCSYTGNRSRGAQQMKCVGNTDVFWFGFNFMSPKWTRTKLIFAVTLPQQAL